MDIEQH